MEVRGIDRLVQQQAERKDEGGAESVEISNFREACGHEGRVIRVSLKCNYSSKRSADLAIDISLMER